MLSTRRLRGLNSPLQKGTSEKLFRCQFVAEVCQYIHLRVARKEPATLIDRSSDAQAPQKDASFVPLAQSKGSSGVSCDNAVPTIANENRGCSNKSHGSLDADIIIKNAPDPIFISDLEGENLISE